MDYLEIRELYHHGIKGQKWGIRRFENEDGTLTAAGKERYGVGDDGKMSKEGKQNYKQDIKETRKEIGKDYKETYNSNIDKYRKQLYGNKHWTNYTDEEANTVSSFAKKDTADALIKKYGERSVQDYTRHKANVNAGAAAVGSVLAIAGTVLAVNLVMKDTGADKKLGSAAGKAFDNVALRKFH